MTAIAAPATTGRLYVGSEVGALRRVVLHRPDLELKRLTPANKDVLLFDDVLWVRRARQEHDAFADALRERGIEVLLLGQLLAGTLAVEGVRECVVDETLRELDLGPRLREELRGWMAGLPVERLAEVLIGGVALDGCPSGPAAWPPPSIPRHWSSRRCPTTCSRATRRAGCTAA